jgi:hypothetical protein
VNELKNKKTLVECDIKMEMRAGCGSDRNGKLFMKGFTAIFYVPQK